jgi:hypothetical protein
VRRNGSERADQLDGTLAGMRFSPKTIVLVVTGVLAIGIAASGCATPWFGNSGATKGAATPATNSPGDAQQMAVSYINGICKLPKEQRDARFRELNEALLPNHAAISCGRGGEF